MYVVKVAVKKSDVDGKGVFSEEYVPKGKIVWIYDPRKDLSATQQEYATFSDEKKAEYSHSAYLSPWTGLWICPPKDDPANYTNHSIKNNLKVEYDSNVSPEPFFIANRDIDTGEELTNNYHDFDEITRKTNPEWAIE